AAQTFTLVVDEAPSITSADGATFVAGSASAFTVTAGGYPTPTFTTTGPLPGGVTLAANGTLGGTPTEGGTFAFTITASNGVAPDATQAFTLHVVQPSTFTSTDATTFTVGQSGRFAVAASGVPAPALSLTSGKVPDGVRFDATSGALAGTPAA